MPRIFAIIVVVAVAMLAVAGTVVAQSTQRYPDVPADHWAFDEINWAVDNDILSPYNDGTFGPDRPLTRARLAKYLHEYHQAFHKGPRTVPDVSSAQPSTTTAPPGEIYFIDHYWSDGGDSYVVVIGNVEAMSYCEVHMTLNGRRTGDWGNDYWGGGRSQVTVTVRFIEYEADGFEANCR